MLTRTIIRLTTALFILILANACVMAGGPAVAAEDGPVQLHGTLSGDLPVSALGQLPAGQQDQAVGVITDQARLDAVLQSLQAGDQTLPEVDFSSQIVLFTRNTVFYNRLSIGQVLRKGDTLTILAMETMSARPITDKVAISLAVIEKAGARYIDSGGQTVEIK